MEVTERVAALLMAADQAFFSVDLRSREVSVSRSLEATFGHRAADLGAGIEAWAGLVHPADTQGVADSLRAALESGVSLWEGEVRVRIVDDSYTLVRCRASILRDASGSPTGLIGSVADVSARVSELAEMRRRTSELLDLTTEVREEEARRRLVDSAVDEALWEWDIATGRATIGGAVRQLFGYQPDEIQATYEWWGERIHPDDRAGIKQSLAMHLAGDLEEWVGLYRFRRADGSYVWVRDHAFLQRGDGKRPRRMAGAVRIIDERVGPAAVGDPVGIELSPRQRQVLDLVRAGHTNKQIAARLRIGEQSVKEHVSRLLARFEAPNRAALVAATSAVAISRDRHTDDAASSGVPILFALMRGPDHVVVSASPGLLALSPDRSPVGKPLRSAYPELAGQGVFELLDVVYRTGQAMRSERFVGRFFRDGSFVAVVVDLSLEPIKNVQGEVDGVLAYGLDVSPRTRADARPGPGLQRQMRALEDLPIGAILTDATGAVTTMNEEARRILGPALADGRPTPAHAAEYQLRDAMTGRPLGPTDTAIARALRGEVVSRIDYLLRPPGCERDIVLRTSAMPVLGPSGVVAVLLTFSEVDPVLSSPTG